MFISFLKYHENDIIFWNCTLSIVKHAYTVALESVISDHVTAPKLPKPNKATQAIQSQHVKFLMHFPSSLSHRSSHFPHLLPLLSVNQT